MNDLDTVVAQALTSLRSGQVTTPSEAVANALTGVTDLQKVSRACERVNVEFMNAQVSQTSADQLFKISFETATPERVCALLGLTPEGAVYRADLRELKEGPLKLSSGVLRVSDLPAPRYSKYVEPSPAVVKVSESIAELGERVMAQLDKTGQDGLAFYRSSVEKLSGLEHRFVTRAREVMNSDGWTHSDVAYAVAQCTEKVSFPKELAQHYAADLLAELFDACPEPDMSKLSAAQQADLICPKLLGQQILSTHPLMKVAHEALELAHTCRCAHDALGEVLNRKLQAHEAINT